MASVPISSQRPARSPCQQADDVGDEDLATSRRSLQPSGGADGRAIGGVVPRDVASGDADAHPRGRCGGDQLHVDGSIEGWRGGMERDDQAIAR